MVTRTMAAACCLVLLGVTAAAADADEQTPVESSVVHVTVYPEWAYVTREARVQLQKDSARLAFKGLPAWIDDESIRARLVGAEGSKIAGVSAKTTYLARSTKAEVQKAEEEVLGLADAMEDLRSELAVIDEERKYFSEIRLWKTKRAPQQAAWRKVNTEELDEVRKFVFGGMAEAVKRATAIRRKIRDLEPELTAKQKALNDLRGRTRLEQKEIVVEIESAAEAKATLSVSYLISGASWYPDYDARTDRDKSNVQLTCEAVVQQSTGEDWADASFTLSTIQPYLTREKPELKPWYVNTSTALSLEFNAEPQAQLSRGSRYNLSPSSSARMQRLKKKQRAGQAGQVLQAFEYNVLRAQAVARQVEERGATVEFDIAGRHAVKADGKPVKLPIGETGLVASLRYAAVPVVSRSTYVTGEMRNTGEFPFLPGEVKVYVDGSLIGKSKVACVAEGENFELYLGLEEQIKVTRDLDAQKSSTSRSGNRKRFIAAYRIEITNFLEAAAVVEVRDQVPVSQDNRIKVKVLGVEPRTGEADKGIITWTVDLAPGESKELRFEFRVDYPAGIYIGNAEALEKQIRAKRKR